MKTTLLQKFIFFTLTFLSYNLSFSQCTAEKDEAMNRYLIKTQTTDAQGCSQCAMLAMYLCSSDYCVKQEDVSKVGTMIQACKTNIYNMGQPYCCQDLLDRPINWGSKAGGTSAGSSATSSGALTNPMTSGTTSTDGTGQLLNAINSLSGGSNAGINEYAKNYAQGQQIAEVANGVIDLFTPSPEEKARKEKARLEAEQRAEEYRRAELQRQMENEKNAKQDFKSSYLDRFKSGTEQDKSNIVVYGMDYYISDKYGYDSSAMVPEWKKWMTESITNNNKFTTTVFAGKALGFNYNKFNYSLDINKDEAIKLLEKIANSEPEYAPYFGISYDVVKKTIKEKNSKKKLVSKEVNTFLLSYVDEGSSAHKIDLKANDKILKINNAYVDDLFKKIQTLKIGDKIDVTYLQNDKEFTKTLVLGSKVKDVHNIDAMLLLANYYNTKAKGNNPEKALYYFTKAAENGSPNAMYALAQIYQDNFYGDKKTNVKFKFKKNEAFAHEWYLKSIANPNYDSSTIQNLYKTGTYFEPKAYDELITMYKKGIGCEKNSAKADEMDALKKVYLSKHPQS
jgi:hypothetical protein